MGKRGERKERASEERGSNLKGARARLPLNVILLEAWRHAATGLAPRQSGPLLSLPPKFCLQLSPSVVNHLSNKPQSYKLIHLFYLYATYNYSSFSEIVLNSHQNNRPHIYTAFTMSRRALLSVPRAITTSVQSSVRPSLASRTASPFLRPAATQPSQRRSYHEKVLDHYSNPRNVGSMDKNATDVGTGASITHILWPNPRPRKVHRGLSDHRSLMIEADFYDALRSCGRPRLW